MRQKRKSNLESLQPVLLGFLIPVLGGLMALLLKSFDAGRYSENLATKPELAEVYKASTKYTDDKAAQTLKEAFEHSDSNRQGMMTEFEKIKGEIKADLAMISGQLAMVLQSNNRRNNEWARPPMTDHK